MHIYIYFMYSSTVEAKGWQTPGQPQPQRMLNPVLQHLVIPCLFKSLKAQPKARLTPAQPPPHPWVKPEGSRLVPPADTLLPLTTVYGGVR